MIKEQIGIKHFWSTDSIEHAVREANDWLYENEDNISVLSFDIEESVEEVAEYDYSYNQRNYDLTVKYKYYLGE